MKKHFLLLTVFLFAGMSFAQTQQKIGYVDSQIILQQLPEAIKAQGDLDALANKWTAQLDSMTQSARAEYADYEKQANTMPVDKKTAVTRSLEEKGRAINDFRMQKFQQNTGELYKKQEEIL